MPEQVYEEVIDAFEALFGKHPGFRRAHDRSTQDRGEQRPSANALIFDPMRLVDGIEASDDLLLKACPRDSVSFQERTASS